MNPWNVSKVSDFLKYCCPECDFQSVKLYNFEKHATQNHELSRTLFENTNNISELSNIIVKEEPGTDYLDAKEVLEVKVNFEDQFETESNLQGVTLIQKYSRNLFGENAKIQINKRL